MCGFTQGASALSTAHVLPGPISVPENNILNGSSAPVWMWDPAEGILTSDIGNIAVVGTAITSRSRSELTESIYGVSEMDQHCMQVIGGMSYDTVVANPEIQYHAGLAHQQVNPVWLPHGQQDMSYHSSSGTGVYWPQMDVGAAMQSHGVTGPVVGAGHPGYQLMPVASPGAAYTGSTMVSVEHIAKLTVFGERRTANMCTTPDCLGSSRVWCWVAHISRLCCLIESSFKSQTVMCASPGVTSRSFEAMMNEWCQL